MKCSEIKVKPRNGPESQTLESTDVSLDEVFDKGSRDAFLTKTIPSNTATETINIHGSDSASELGDDRREGNTRQRLGIRYRQCGLPERGPQ